MFVVFIELRNATLLKIYSLRLVLSCSYGLVTGITYGLVTGITKQQPRCASGAIQQCGFIVMVMHEGVARTR